MPSGNDSAYAIGATDISVSRVVVVTVIDVVYAVIIDDVAVVVAAVASTGVLFNTKVNSIGYESIACYICLKHFSRWWKFGLSVIA